MPTEPGAPNPGAPNPQQMWEAGARTLMEGWQQAQTFWSNAARNWGNTVSTPTPPAAGQAAASEGLAVWRDLAEAAFAVGQAWMRLPLALATGAQPSELQTALTRLTEAQGRAYTLWAEAMQKVSDTARSQGGPKSS
jgi:hypothetical protein